MGIKTVAKPASEVKTPSKYLTYQLLCIEKQSVASLRCAEGLLVVAKTSGWEHDLVLWSYDGLPLQEFKGVQSAGPQDALYLVTI